jgi:sphinganine-1-phosphate aldolase
MDVSATARAIGKNTILIYASAPGYPHGAIDPVEDLAALAKKRGVCLHVDACLGGFVLPFIPSSNQSTLPLFDFRAPGVTSLSVDTHKYGLSQKGSSVVLYASSLLRQYQYTAVMDWSGGLYISPSQPGSRSGGLIAQTWASLLHLGRNGYQVIANRIFRAAVLLRDGISHIHGLQVLGSDVSMVVAWGSSDPLLDIYVVNDIMITKGWHLSVLHTPAALHMCITPANLECVSELLNDLKAAVDETRNSSDGEISGGKAPIYGLAGALPDRDLVGDILKDVQDLMLKHV